jgi:hypothetical protein
VDSFSPIAIIKAPLMTVQRTPIRSATRPIKIPPKPEPSQTNAPAKAGIARSPLTSAAMFLSATTVIHGAPKETAITRSAAVATTHDVRVSTVGGDVDVSMSLALPSRPAGLVAFLQHITVAATPRPGKLFSGRE